MERAGNHIQTKRYLLDRQASLAGGTCHALVTRSPPDSEGDIGELRVGGTARGDENVWVAFLDAVGDRVRENIVRHEYIGTGATGATAAARCSGGDVIFDCVRVGGCTGGCALRFE